MHLSSFIGIPLVYKIGINQGVEPSMMQQLTPGYWLTFSFSVALVIILLILKKAEIRQTRLHSDPPMHVQGSTFWAIAGVFLAFFAQDIAIRIELLLGVTPGSENTQQIIQIIEYVPFTMIVASILGPILEEIVFRKVIFGSLYERFPFWVAALISSVIFSAAHMELEHTLLYSAMGFTFAFLYVKTKRLIVPIIAHVSMNTLVILGQYFFRDELEKYIEEAEKISGFIGGFF